jgi:tetratricopeptide (TPR) repeat protein
MKSKSFLSSGTVGWCAACALVLGIYGSAARSGAMELMCPSPSETYYNLLSRGFSSGRLSLLKEAPPGLARLADPYDPVANAAYDYVPQGLHDMSYYKGKLYLYFGPTPALVLFWPFAALTGRYLWQRQAAAIFCAAGFLAGACLLRSLRRRYFPEIGGGVLAAGVIVFGLATSLPMILARIEVYEVAITCGYMLTLFALAAIWQALHRPQHRGRWLAAASAAYGLAVAARPSLLPGAACLLVPLLLECFPAGESRRGRLLLRRSLCALGPIAAIGLGLALYNYERFGQALEFGQHYQLAGDRQDTARHFSAHYLWFNFRVYFIGPVQFTGHFPFVHRPAPPAQPAGHQPAEDPFGVLTNIPVLWLALAAPWVWRNRARETRALRAFVLAVAVLFGASALTLCLFYGSCSRYEAEFLPELALLAVVGIFVIEQALAGRASLRLMARCGWGLLLAWSVAFNLLVARVHYADARPDYGVLLAKAGRETEAIRVYDEALRIDPDCAMAQHNLAFLLAGIPGRLPEAIDHYERALQIDPSYAAAENNLANALASIPGRLPEAIDHYERALRIDPNFTAAHNNLGIALSKAGRADEGLEQFEQAVRLKPDYAEAHSNLGVALYNAGRFPEAIDQCRQALRLGYDRPEVHYFLGLALAQTGRGEEAVAQLREALRLQPDFPEAREDLDRLLSAP